MAGEEARWQLYKNVAGNIEQVLAATPQRHQLYGHLPPITKTIQVRRTRHTGHCWRSKDEPISDIFLWTSTYGRAKAGWPAQTYTQQLCEDTGCSFEDLPKAMIDREKWRESVRDIRASSTTWWWWWCLFHISVSWVCYTYTSSFNGILLLTDSPHKRISVHACTVRSLWLATKLQQSHVTCFWDFQNC